MGLFSFFKKSDDKLHTIDRMLIHSFNKVKHESTLVFTWLHYFREKDRVHDDRYSAMQKQLNLQASQIVGMQREFSGLKSSIFRIEFDQGQVGTPERTSKGQVKDMSQRNKDAGEDMERQIIDKSRLKGSELELLQLLYHSDRPLGYQEIAKRLSKTQKSIRNLIYEIRKKNIDVKSRAVGVREKGFYLTEQTKIAVSGR